MQELSIEQKAKAYDEAYKVAENIHRFSSDLAEIKRMEEIFPELKESEDEKIRKEIIEYIKTGTYHKSWIAWLEKQKPVIIPKFRVGDVVRHIPNEVNKSQAEYRITRIDDKFYYSELEDGVEFILFGFPVEDTWELVKPDSTDWGEKDEKIKKAVCEVLARTSQSETILNDWGVEYSDAIIWLKSLKDRVQPQPKQEWSEEDENG